MKGRICRICDAKHILRANYMPQKIEVAKLLLKIAQASKEEQNL